MAQERQEGFRAEGLLRIHCCECRGKLPVLRYSSAMKKVKTMAANTASTTPAESFYRVTVRFRETGC
jgi:hypothetical protein